MRIIKGIDIAEDARIIAKEMYNIESCTLIYEGNKKLDEPKKGYPVIVIDEIRRVFRSTVGYIWVGVDVNRALFEKEIVGAMAELEIISREPDHLRNWQTVSSSYHTNIKLQSSLKRTAHGKYAGSNVKRYITSVVPASSNMGARFTWIIVPINALEGPFMDNELATAVHKNITSIFYDVEDVCILNNLDVTFEFSKKLLRSHEKVVQATLNLTNLFNPMAILSRGIVSENFLKSFNFKHEGHNIDPSKVWRADFGTLKIMPTNTPNGPSKEACKFCKCQIYGENYVLFNRLGKIPKGDTTLGIPACFACIHLGITGCSINRDYQYIVRTQFPKSYDDFIKEVENPVLRDICQHVIRGLVKKNIKWGNSYIECVEIGDDYVAVSDQRMIYKKLPENYDRKICFIKNINLIE